MSLIAINPDSGLACLNIGNSYFRRRDFKVANEWYTRAIGKSVMMHKQISDGIIDMECLFKIRIINICYCN